MPVFDLGDGGAMPYADIGEGAPVLLVHGWAAHGGFFSDLSARLGRSYRVLTPTLRGHAGAPAGARPLSIGALGEDLTKFAGSLELEGVTALGWSMGAMALWSAAPALAPRLSGLIAVEMSPKLLNDEAWRFGLAGGYGAGEVDETLAEIQSDWPAYVARFAPRLFAPGIGAREPHLTAWAMAEMSRADPNAMAQLWASMTRQDFRGALGELGAPMLVIAGAQSQIYPDGATQFVVEAAPRARRVVAPGAGHTPQLESADTFFAFVDGFLRETSRRTSMREGAHP